MTPPDLAGIIERDRQSVTWADFDAEVPQRVSDAVWQAAADRRALLGLLRETRDLAALSFYDKGFGPTVNASDLARYHKARKRVGAALAALAEP